MLTSFTNEKDVNEFLNLITVNEKKLELKLDNIKIFNEMSLSDFGDSDFILLGENQRVGKICIFFEAKVKTFSIKNWTLKRYCNEFKEGIQKGKLKSSNIFTQLWHKYKLTENINNIDGLSDGISFPPFSTKQIRKIGKNPIVNKIIDRIREYSNEYYFIMIIPHIDDCSFSDVINVINQNKDVNFKKENFGYLLWKDIENFCRNKKYQRVIENFEFNEEQIY